MPFHTNKGITHYYGVGAYLRPVSDVRSHSVKFSPECLGFANIPITKTRNDIMSGQLPVVHHPKWKDRTPRDSGAGWDFEDVRDHYTRELFAVDPIKLRSYDPESYLALSEITPGELMYQVFSEWRSQYSQCNGGLIWFMKDFLPGAGWGIIDSSGLPKACYYYLKRSWQPVTVCVTNETLNGLHLHVVNDSGNDFSGMLKIVILNSQNTVTGEAILPVEVKARSSNTYESDDIMNGFYDITYSYRFGPSKHSIVAVSLTDHNSLPVSTAYYFPDRALPITNNNVELTANLVQLNDDSFMLTMQTDVFLYAVNIDVPGYLASDNFFHLIPGEIKDVRLARHDTDNDKKVCKGYITALNMLDEIKIRP